MQILEISHQRRVRVPSICTNGAHTGNKGPCWLQSFWTYTCLFYHVLCCLFKQRPAIQYNLRSRPHPFALQERHSKNFLSRHLL